MISKMIVQSPTLHYLFFAKLLLIVLIAACGRAIAIPMPGNDPATIKAIDQEYSRAVDAYLNYSASTLLGDTAKKQNPNELARHVKAALDTDKIDFALTLIKANITTITNKIDSPRTVVFVEHLLDYGLLDTALQIVNHAHTHASVDTNSTLHYQLALYYSVRDDT
ncbi:MAG: hypothetical protein ACI9Y1_001413, partial [Lentisphaeria bacterium]